MDSTPAPPGAQRFRDRYGGVLERMVYTHVPGRGESGPVGFFRGLEGCESES